MKTDMKYQSFGNSGNSGKEGALKTFSQISATIPETLSVSFNFRPEMLRILVQWKAALVSVQHKKRQTWTYGQSQ